MYFVAGNRHLAVTGIITAKICIFAAIWQNHCHESYSVNEQAFTVWDTWSLVLMSKCIRRPSQKFPASTY